MTTDAAPPAADILLSSTSTAPFVQQAALAFREAGRLREMLSTWVDRPQLRWRRALRATIPAMARPLDRTLSRRNLRLLGPALPTIRCLSRWELLRSLVGKLDRRGVWTDRIWQLGQSRFDQWAARQLRADLHAVYAFETGALSTFTRAAQLGVRRWYEVNAAEHDGVHQLLSHEYARYPELSGAYQQHTQRLQQARTQWRKQEWQLADRVILYSNYVARTYAAAGYPMERVRIVPLAAPMPVSSAALRPAPCAAPLRLLWVGSFSIRKGAHLLVEAWRDHELGRHASLDVYGRNELPPSLNLELPGLRWHGSVPQVELRDAYLDADALIFPTLSDSFGMVVTEALAHGCPVLTTDAAGAAELLSDGVNSRVIAAGNRAALSDLLNWSVAQRAQLREWKTNALDCARQWQWADYRLALRQACDLPA